MIVFQGLEDEVVPPAQAEEIVAALKRTASPTPTSPRGRAARLPDRREHHRLLERELAFYGRIFGFEPAGEIEPVEVEGLD